MSCIPWWGPFPVIEPDRGQISWKKTVSNWKKKKNKEIRAWSLLILPDIPSMGAFFHCISSTLGGHPHPRPPPHPLLLIHLLTYSSRCHRWLRLSSIGFFWSSSVGLCWIPGTCKSREGGACTYTVQGQGLPPLALGSAQPGPTRARVRARCWCLGPALIGSSAKTSDLARPRVGPARPCLRVGLASLPQENKIKYFHSFLLSVTYYTYIITAAHRSC